MDPGLADSPSPGNFSPLEASERPCLQKPGGELPRDAIPWLTSGLHLSALAHGHAHPYMHMCMHTHTCTHACTPILTHVHAHPYMYTKVDPNILSMRSLSRSCDMDHFPALLVSPDPKTQDRTRSNLPLCVASANT